MRAQHLERHLLYSSVLIYLTFCSFSNIQAEACKRPGAHLQLTVVDYDVMTDDVAGQVLAPLSHVPGLTEEIPATFSGIEQVMLPIIHPTPDGKYFESKYKFECMYRINTRERRLQARYLA